MLATYTLDLSPLVVADFGWVSVVLILMCLENRFDKAEALFDYSQQRRLRFHVLFIQNQVLLCILFRTLCGTGRDFRLGI